MLPFTANPNRTFNILNWLTEAPGDSNIVSFDFFGHIILELRYGNKVVETILHDDEWLIRNIHTNTYYVVSDDCVRDNFTIL